MKDSAMSGSITCLWFNHRATFIIKLCYKTYLVVINQGTCFYMLIDSYY
jgi:hypothetical protein